MKRIALLAVTALLCLTAVAQLANQDPYYARRATLFDELPIGKKDIVMLGNSLTDGCEFNELMGNRHIKNRGIVGDIVQGLIDRIDPIIKGQPKKMFIMCGVNDISHDVSADSIARAMERLIVMVKQGSPRTRIYLQSLLPFNNDVREWKLLKGREHVVVEANALLEQVAHRQGVTWINLYPLFADNQGRLRADLTNDGLHLMGQGYLIWRDALAPHLK
ncbi:MAG: sialate O-acetylesterase [Muribaculaceae bacterium]|nr:sialate O-acetylesterase [Muribaculaceae bacterium]